MNNPPTPWQTFSLAGQRVEFLEPAGAIPERALLVVPSRGGRASDEGGLTRYLLRNRLRAVAPVAKSWWLNLLEPDFHRDQTPLAFLEDDLLGWIAEHWDAAPPRVDLLGWEEGGQGLLQLAFRRPRDFARLAVIDAAVDFHELHGDDPTITQLFSNREAARQETATLRLHPAGGPRKMLLIADRRGHWFEGVDRLDMKLRSMGNPVETLFFPDEQSSELVDRPSAIARALDHLSRESLDFPVVGRT